MRKEILELKLYGTVILTLRVLKMLKNLSLSYSSSMIS